MTGQARVSFRVWDITDPASQADAADSGSHPPRGVYNRRSQMAAHVERNLNKLRQCLSFSNLLGRKGSGKGPKGSAKQTPGAAILLTCCRRRLSRNVRMRCGASDRSGSGA